MRRNWRYGKRISFNSASATILFVAVLFFSSCSNSEEHKHIADKSLNDLDGLVQPVNQTVFSSVKTITAKQQSVMPMLNASGVITYNPQLINNISARFSGRIEKLYVRFNFSTISKGQRIMDIYSPDILTEQQNLIFLLNNSSTDMALINSSKQKLQLLGLTNEQLKQIETSKQPINPIPVYSPYSGHIHDIGISNGVTSTTSSMSNGMSSGMNTSTQSSSETQIENLPSSQSSALTIKEGMYLQSGQPVFSVYDISQVWAVLNIFPQDAAMIKVGDKVSITAETNPTNIISSTISYIEPVAGQNASAIKARVYLQNAENLHLKIGTLLTAQIMPSEINGLWLPRNAVVNIGKKQVIFIKSENHFTAGIVKTGFQTDSLIQITNGLTGREQIAENAQFLVDSESFIKTQDNEK